MTHSRHGYKIHFLNLKCQISGTTVLRVWAICLTYGEYNKTELSSALYSVIEFHRLVALEVISSSHLSIGSWAPEETEDGADYLDDCPGLAETVPDVAESVTAEVLSGVS